MALDTNPITRIQKTYESPLIGIIGATHPSEGYAPQMSLDVGFILRSYLEGKRGALFTGGVEGVGIDSYRGIVKYSLEQNVSDRFFVLVPHHHYTSPSAHGFTGFGDITFLQNQLQTKMVKTPYPVPISYRLLANSINKNISVERAGDTLSERRQHVAAIADILIVVNGGLGTFDEAQCCLSAGKPIITLPYTHGAASVLSDISRQEVQHLLLEQLVEQQIDFSTINLSLIHSVDSASGLPAKLTEILDKK